jgi:hypothetical protein
MTGKHYLCSSDNQSNEMIEEPKGHERSGPLPGAPKAWRLLRLIVQHLFNLLQHSWREFWNESQSFNVLMNLFDLCRTQNHGANIRIDGCPRKRQLSDRAAETFGNLGQLADFFNLGFAVFVL